MRRDRNPSVGTTVTGGVVSLRVNARFGSLDEATRQLKGTEDACRDALGDLIYGADEQSLPEVVLGQLAWSTGGEVPPVPDIATAESCTGGLLAKMITDVPGSSMWFRQGWVTYSNESKTKQLGVPEELIRSHGAVSEPVASAMAQGARGRALSVYGIGITGIAGPDGGTPQKPVGTVCIAVGDRGNTSVRTFLFPGDREMIRDRSAKMALTMLRYHLLGKPLPF